MSVSGRNCDGGGLALYRLFSFASNVSTCLSYFSLVTTLLAPCITESWVFVICISLGNFVLTFLLGNRSSIWNTIPFHDQCLWRWSSPLLLQLDFCLHMFIYFGNKEVLATVYIWRRSENNLQELAFSFHCVVDRDWILIVYPGSKRLHRLTSFSAPESIVLF